MGKALIRAAQIGAGLLIALLIIGLYKAKTDAAKTEAHVRALELQISETEARLRALRAEIAGQETPERIEALARRHLGPHALEETPALPEAAIDQRLPAPKARE